jgi:hypothetical protein
MIYLNTVYKILKNFLCYSLQGPLCHTCSHTNSAYRSTVFDPFLLGSGSMDIKGMTSKDLFCYELQGIFLWNTAVLQYTLWFQGL